MTFLLQEPSLYTIKAILIVDNDGNRIISKVSANASDLCPCFWAPGTQRTTLNLLVFAKDFPRWILNHQLTSASFISVLWRHIPHDERAESIREKPVQQNTSSQWFVKLCSVRFDGTKANNLFAGLGEGRACDTPTSHSIWEPLGSFCLLTSAQGGGGCDTPTRLWAISFVVVVVLRGRSAHFSHKCCLWQHDHSVPYSCLSTRVQLVFVLTDDCIPRRYSLTLRSFFFSGNHHVRGFDVCVPE